VILSRLPFHSHPLFMYTGRAENEQWKRKEILQKEQTRQSANKTTSSCVFFVVVVVVVVSPSDRFLNVSSFLLSFPVSLFHWSFYYAVWTLAKLHLYSLEYRSVSDNTRLVSLTVLFPSNQCLILLTSLYFLRVTHLFFSSFSLSQCQVDLLFLRCC
jgi:predicted nucleic acid-binding Zn ribbon protein